MDMLKLINLVRNHRNLWDKTCKEYCDRDVNKASWSAIAEELNASVDLCKTKWCNVRDTFRREYKKIENSRDGDDGLLEPRWKYYKPLSFLLTQVAQSRKRPKNSRLAKVDKVVDIQEYNSSDNEPLVVKHENVENDTENSTKEVEEETPFTFVQVPSTSPLSHKRKFSSVNIDDEKLIKVRRTLTRDEICDPDRMFLLSLLPYLKKFPDEKKLSVRHKIQGIILEELSNESYSNHNKQTMMVNIHSQPSNSPSQSSTLCHQNSSTMYTTNTNDQNASSPSMNESKVFY